MLVNFFKTKLKGLTYRIEILEECRRLKKAGRILPKNYQSLIWSKPIVYDDFINFLCFLDNKTKVNLIDVGANIGEFSKNTVGRANYYRDQLAIPLTDLLSLWSGIKAGFEHLVKWKNK